MPTSVYKFGDFELDPSRFELKRNGRVQKLERIPMDLLILLAEKDGNVATRQEIVERLWGKDVFVDTEHGINTAISKIRQVLRDDPEEPQFILTVTGKGYRFVPLVVRINGGNGSAAVASTLRPGGHSLTDSIEPSEKTGVAAPRPVAARHMSLFLLGSLGVIAFAVWLSFSSPPTPRITGATQLTSDGRLKFGPIATDGLRLYFSEEVNGQSIVASIPVSGGEPVPLQMSLREATLLGISPDRLDLLVAEGEFTHKSALWRVPALGGTPRRLGSIIAHDASWSPDGKKLAYVNGSDLYLASADGTNPRKVLSGKDSSVWAWHPLWSPDGKRLRWDYYEMGKHGAKIWEMNADGGNPHPLLPASEDWPMQAYGDWTPNGKYYIFTSWKDLESGSPWPASNLWAIREGVRFFRRLPASPTNLTTGPMHYFSHTSSADGKTIFAISSQKHGELVRYDIKAGAFVPYSGGLSAEGVAFSRDKRWRAYVKYPQGELWRSREDGSEALQLTYRPLFAVDPEWSPDGKQIAFSGQRAGEKWQVYTVSAQGGSPQLVPEAVDPVGITWSPDGRSVIFGNAGGIRSVDLGTRIVTTITGSDGLGSPRLSPDGLNMVASDGRRLMLFNFKTKVWAERARMEQLGWVNWSADGNYVYFVGATSDDSGIVRISVKGGGKSEKIVSLLNFRSTGAEGGWFSLGPADELLLLKNTGGGTEVYALSWNAQ